MPLIRKIHGIEPQLGKPAFIAENATIVGKVSMGNQCSVWYNAVIRGDVNSIYIGHKSNIQDGAVIHCTYKRSKTYIGDNVTIGHNAIVHGCTVCNGSLIGMGAIVMDNAVVEENVLVAAGTVVLEGMRLERGHIYAGIPARKIKPLSKAQLTFLWQTPLNYMEYASWID